MFLRFVKRGAVLSATVLLAALVAAGCGSGAKSGAGKAAASSGGGLSFVPKSALLYVTFDTDFSDANWDRARKLGKNFPQYDTQRDKLMSQLNKGGTNKLTYNTDVKPWLGKDAGAAVLLASGAKSKGHIVAWLATKSEAKTITAIKKGGAEADTAYKGTKTYSANKDKTYFAVNDGYLLITDDEATLHAAIDTKKGAASIGDDKTTVDAAKHIDDGSVVALVMGREGVKSAIKAIKADSSSTASASLDKVLKQVKVNNFNGLALGVAPKDHGVALDGWVGNGGKTKLPDDASPTLLTDLPATTALAVAGSNLGGGLDGLIKGLGQSDPKVAAQISQGETALGLSDGALTKAFGGKFSISAGGGASPAVALVVQNHGSDTKTTLDKLIGVSALAGVTPEDLTVKGGSGKKLTFGSVTIAAGTLSDVSIITNQPDWLNTWGTGATLGDSDQYKRVTDEAGLPAKVGALVYVDPTAAAALGQSVSKTGIGASLTSKLKGAAAGATGTTTTGDGMAMGGATTSTDSAAAMASATDALKYLGPILFWTQSDSDNLEFHAFSEITDGSGK